MPGFIRWRAMLSVPYLERVRVYARRETLLAQGSTAYLTVGVEIEADLLGLLLLVVVVVVVGRVMRHVLRQRDASVHVRPAA